MNRRLLIMVIFIFIMFSDKNFKIFVSIIKYNMLKSEERELVYDAIKESSDNEKSMFMIQQDW